MSGCANGRRGVDNRTVLPAETPLDTRYRMWYHACMTTSRPQIIDGVPHINGKPVRVSSMERQAAVRRKTTPADEHGAYALWPSTVGSGYVIRRNDPDHARTVATIESRYQWRKFVTAIESGADEVAAVRAIDA